MLITSGPSRPLPWYLGALKRRVTCNCGPRGTVSCGFQVSKEQLDEERLKREGHAMQGMDGWMDGNTKDGWMDFFPMK